MKYKRFLASSAAIALVASCSINPHRLDMSQAVQSAKTPGAHEALAIHSEEAAKQMQAKANEQKILLAQYEGRGLDGRQFHDFIIHCQWLIRVYEQAAMENLSMAKSPSSCSMRDDTGLTMVPTAVENKGSGHHRESILTFPRATLEAKWLELVISDIAGVKERTFRWERK